MTNASGEKVTVYGGSDEMCPAPVSHEVDSDEFWFMLKMGVIVVITAVFCLGCWCGYYFKSLSDRSSRSLFQKAVSPAPGDTTAPTTRADVKVETVRLEEEGSPPRSTSARRAWSSSQQDRGARHKLFHTFLVVDLRVVLRAKSLPVSGIKEDLVTRLIKHGRVLSDQQAKEIEQLRVMATASGPLVRLNLQDISSPEAAQKWIETFKASAETAPEAPR